MEGVVLKMEHIFLNLGVDLELNACVGSFRMKGYACETAETVVEVFWRVCGP